MAAASRLVLPSYLLLPARVSIIGAGRRESPLLLGARRGPGAEDDSFAVAGGVPPLPSPPSHCWGRVRGSSGMRAPHKHHKKRLERERNGEEALGI